MYSRSTIRRRVGEEPRRLQTLAFMFINLLKPSGNFTYDQV
jgi:hypothetical protein